MWGGEDVWTEWFSHPPTGFLLLGDYAGFAISVSQCIYFSSHGWVLLWSNVAISRAFILLLNELWSQLLKPCTGHSGHVSELSTLVLDDGLLQKGLSCKTYIRRYPPKCASLHVCQHKLDDNNIWVFRYTQLPPVEKRFSETLNNKDFRIIKTSYIKTLECLIVHWLSL